MKSIFSFRIKNTLYAVLSCITLSFVATACSNEEAPLLPKENTGNGISFTATMSVPVEYTTRVGIDGDKITDDLNGTEPVIWLNGDSFSFNFVKAGDQTGKGKIIKYVASNVSDNGMSCVMNADPALEIEDGFYQVYVLTPHQSGNFVEGALNKSTIDLSGQNQPSNAKVDDFNNLQGYVYQYATTIVRIQDNEIVMGDTRLRFNTITSMLRFKITNGTDNQATIKRIAISHKGNSESQFYSAYSYDPINSANPFSEGTRVKTLALGTNQILSMQDAFDTYLSIFPTQGYPSGTNDQLSITIYFDKSGVAMERTWDVPASSFPNNARFLSGERFFLRLNLVDAGSVISVTDFSISPSSLTFTSLNTTQTISKTIAPSNAGNQAIEWSSSDTNVADVNNAGVVTSKGNGTCTIYATCAGITRECTVTVLSDMKSTVSLDPQAGVYTGQEKQTANRR